VRFLLLVYGDDAGAPANGVLASYPVEPAWAATSVLVRDDETRLGDGPYASADPDLGRVDVVEADSLDEAIDAAARLPEARSGGVEIRPVRDGEAAA
jgi:hypothetical protein